MSWRTKLAYLGVISTLIGLAWILGWLAAKYTHVPAYPVFSGRSSRSVEPDWLARLGQQLGVYMQEYGLWLLATITTVATVYFFWVLLQYFRLWQNHGKQLDSQAGLNISWAMLGFGGFAFIAIDSIKYLL